MSVLVCIVLLCVVLLTAVRAEDLDLTLSATVNQYSAELEATTNDAANSSYEGYDLIGSATAPSTYATLRSNISNTLVSVDTWNSSENPRTLNVTFATSSSQTGTLNVTWNLADDSHTATLVDYGTNSSFQNAIVSINLSNTSSYTTSMTSTTRRYFQLSVSNVVTTLLSNPSNGVSYSSNSQSVSFQYSVSAAVSVSSCSLYINSALTSTDTSVTRGDTNTFSSSFTPGTYTWYISCVDAGGVSGTSSTRSFTVTAASTVTTTSARSSSAETASESTVEAPLVSDAATGIAVPSGLSFSVFTNTPTTRSFTLRNDQATAVTLAFTIIGFDSSVNGSSFVILGPHEERKIDVQLDALASGLQTGFFIFGNAETNVTIPVIINARSENFLFDSILSVSQEQRIIAPGEPLRAQIDLTQVGPDTKVDVTATYVIKDFSGKVYREDSETFFVLGSKNYIKSFATDDLPPGEYILGLELFYEGAFATSSVRFSVQSKRLLDSSYSLYILLVALCCLAIIAGIWYVRSSRAAIMGALHRRGRKV